MSVSLPPEYDQANRHLQPDIAPLPKINNINPDNPVEGNKTDWHIWHTYIQHT